MKIWTNKWHQQIIDFSLSNLIPLVSIHNSTSRSRDLVTSKLLVQTNVCQLMLDIYTMIKDAN